MEILRRSGIPLEGANAVVLGRSDIVGKPMALLLMHANATVTICHSKTRDLPQIVRRADIVVAAMGRAAMVTPDWIRPGATVIDVGINRITDRRAKPSASSPSSRRRLEQFREKGSVLVGDVHPDVVEIAGAITPVPGGVGPLTIAMLMSNTIKAARLRRGQQPPAPAAGPLRYALMLRVGLTGGIGCGKSTVAAMMRELGCHVLDADQMAHALIGPASPPTTRSSGNSAARSLLRMAASTAPRLAAIVFADPLQLARLERHHPSARSCAKSTGSSSGSPRADPRGVAVVEAALLIESGYYQRLDRLILAGARPSSRWSG